MERPTLLEEAATAALILDELLLYAMDFLKHQHQQQVMVPPVTDSENDNNAGDVDVNIHVADDSQDDGAVTISVRRRRNGYYRKS